MTPEPAALGEDSRSHIAKWLAREPEMETALLFAASGRPLAALWGAVLDAWLEACFMPSDAGVARVKLAWWGEALGQASAESAHPLVRAFALAGGDAVPAALWADAAHSALELVSREAHPTDFPALIGSRMDLGRALAAVESALWPDSGVGDAGAVARSLVVWQWRQHRRERDPHPGWLPLQLLARHSLRAQDVYANPADPAVAPLLADMAEALLGCPCAPVGPRLRRARTRLDTLALRRLRRGHPQPFAGSGLGILWQSWCASRGVAG